VSLRKSSPAISIEDLRKITTLFPTPGYSFPLDPTFEPEMKGRDEGMQKPVEENTRKKSKFHSPIFASNSHSYFLKKGYLHSRVGIQP
jgi:hypothetical protein